MYFLRLLQFSAGFIAVTEFICNFAFNIKELY